MVWCNPRSSNGSLRKFPLVRDFRFRVATNFLEHSFGAFIEKGVAIHSSLIMGEEWAGSAKLGLALKVLQNLWLGLPSLQKCVCEICGEIWFGIRFETWNLRWEKSGEIWGEDFSTCQESTGNFVANFGANFGENFGNFVSNFAAFHLPVVKRFVHFCPAWPDQNWLKMTKIAKLTEID